MAQAIIEQFQLNGSTFFKDDKRKLTGMAAGALGFSFGLTFSDVTETQYGFRSKMSLLCDKLAMSGHSRVWVSIYRMIFLIGLRLLLAGSLT